MSRIKFFGLGGLGENGKNMFVTEVDERIFILDAGLKYPSVDLYGIDAVIPDISYLVENKNRVQGLFISHGHEDHIGAAVEILKRLNIGVFGTHFTISILEDMIQEEGLAISDFRLYRINDEKQLKFGPVTVSFYSVNHSIPETINIAIQTADGSIVYAPDFTFDVNIDHRYRISFDKIAQIAQNGVLALCAESLGTSNVGRVNNDFSMTHTISEVLQQAKRVIFSTFSSDLDRIQKIINISVNYKRRIAIIGRKAQKIVHIAMNSGYLRIPEENLVNLRYMDNENDNNQDDLVVIVTGNRHEPFYMLQRMCRGVDRLIAIQESDHIVIVTPPVPGTEKMAARTIDILYKSTPNVIEIKKDMLKSTHADNQELQMLYNMLNPKYIIPIIGEYRHQYSQKQVALDAGYDQSNILLLENGEVAIFEDKQLLSNKERVPAGDVLVDGSIIGDINEIVLKDRELLSQEGTVLISAMIDSKQQVVLGEIEVVTKGLILHEEIQNQLKEMVNNFIMHHLHKWDLEFLNQQIQQDVAKELKRLTKKYPIVASAIIDVA